MNKSLGGYDYSPNGGFGGGAPASSGNSGYGGFNSPSSSPAGQPKSVGTGYGGFSSSSTPSAGQPSSVGFSFSTGGAVPDADGDDDGDTDGSPGQDMMAKALQSVDATLQYSYQKYGLGGGQQEAGGQQQAGIMPSVPPSQSETGIPLQQPMPGPLPPTSNPFGKRASADDGVPGNQGSWEGPLTSGPSPLAPKPIGPQQPEPPVFQPLPPTGNPFGKRSADAGDTGAIDTEDAA